MGRPVGVSCNPGGSAQDRGNTQEEELRQEISGQNTEDYLNNWIRGDRKGGENLKTTLKFLAWLT